MLFLVCLIASGAVLLNATSSWLRQSHPQAALQLNPLNAEARIDLAVDGLASENADTDRLRRLILEGIAFSPIDARFYSLLGIVEERGGDRAAATYLFDRSLALLPTEIQALTHRLAHEVENRNFMAAVDHVELIARRWSEHWPIVEPVLPAMLADDQVFEAMARRFGQDDRLRRRLVLSLSNSEQTVSLAYSILLRWHKEGVDELDGLINHTTARLIREARYLEAFLLFRLTRPSDSGSDSGYVYNGEFRQAPSGNPFDWQVRSQSGVDFQWVAEDSEEAGQDQALVVRFLNNPIQFRNIAQHIRLMPGPYELSLTYSADDLSAPKPLRLAIGCIGGGNNLAEVELAPGRSGEITVVRGFHVPPSGCPLQQLYVFNEKMPMSWRNRYTGSLRLDRVAIARTEG